MGKNTNTQHYFLFQNDDYGVGYPSRFFIREVFLCWEKAVKLAEKLTIQHFHNHEPAFGIRSHYYISERA